MHIASLFNFRIKKTNDQLFISTPCGTLGSMKNDINTVFIITIIFFPSSSSSAKSLLVRSLRAYVVHMCACTWVCVCNCIHRNGCRDLKYEILPAVSIGFFSHFTRMTMAFAPFHFETISHLANKYNHIYQRI